MTTPDNRAFLPRDSERYADILRPHFNDLTEAATTNLGGYLATVTRTSAHDFYQRYPDIQVNLHELLTPNNINSWKTILERLLLTPDKSFRNISFREPNIDFQETYLRIPPDDPVVLMPMKFTYTTTIADLEGPKNNTYPDDPYKGRPQILLGSLDIFSDTRRELTGIHSQLIDQASTDSKARENLIILNDRRQIIIERSKAGQDPFLKEALTSCEEVPLIGLSVVFRNTYFDKEMRECQPINTAGFLLTESISGEIALSRLAPWINHKSWEELPLDYADNLIDNYHSSHYPLLNHNLRQLAQAISQNQYS